MACDLQGTVNGRKFKLFTKIWKFEHSPCFPDAGPFIVGMAGIADEMIQVADFYNDPSGYDRPPKVKGTCGVILTKTKKIFYWSDPSKWLQIYSKQYAIGSGGDIAIGAMLSGATPEEACKAASKVDVNTGMGFKTLSFA